MIHMNTQQQALTALEQCMKASPTSEIASFQTRRKSV
jgi:hypothetical protein